MEIIMRKIVRISFACLIGFAVTAFLYRPGKAHTPANALAEEKQLNIIFDLGGVLVSTSRLRTFWHLGPRAVFSYLYNNPKEMVHIKKKLYQIIEQSSDVKSNPFVACDAEGTLLPYLMCEWLANQKTAQEIRTIVTEKIIQNPHWFKNKAEQRIILKMTQMIFTPELFISTTKIVKDGIEFVRECKTKGHRVFVLSNWDAESFALLLQRYPHAFSLFDGIIISGHVQDLKPNKSMYNYFTKTLPADSCVFIDDQKENIRTAKECGMHTIHCTKKKAHFHSSPNFNDIREKLNSIEQNQLTINRLLQKSAI